MTVASDPSDTPPKETTMSLEDLLSVFSVSDWLDASTYVSDLPETSPESNIRAMTELEYRKATTPTKWVRYLTLGRYAMDGFTFDSCIEEMSSDPLKLHCIIWYQYQYHLDHKLVIPFHLLSGASRCSQPYLTLHAESAIDLDTYKVTWQSYSRSLSLNNSWSEVTSKLEKKKSKRQASQSSTSNAAASSVGTGTKPATIPEETSTSSNSTTQHAQGQPSNKHQDTPSVASDGKMSVLMPQSKVPVCDGTYRVIFKLKISDSGIMQRFRNPTTMKEEIHKFLNELFKDGDGSLYKWDQPGTDSSSLISTLSPNSVRQFISPSVTIMPSLSTVILPIRFGFAGKTPGAWRNTAETKEILTRYGATVTLSNSTTTSGKLVVAGYILLKAPMTTHRLRYLQSLRQMLPDNTPPFDILLHKRTPTDQLMPHLVAQCGESHVHSLSEALATILTGTQSALYIPRFAFEQMTPADASALFASHDEYVKALNWLSLYPLLSNLDRIRKEYNPDGSITERSTRDWARNIRTTDGKGYAQCDVVNGGTDQLCYLLFPPQDKEAAQAALDAYRRRLYPFTQREAKFRAEVGAPPAIVLSKRVIANLDFIKNLSSPVSKAKATDATVSEETASEVTGLEDMASEATESAETASAVSNSPSNSKADSTDSSISSVSQATRPPTSGESLRKRYRDIDQNSEASQTSENSSASTTASTNLSHQSTGRLSVSSAKFREFDKILLRHQQESETKEARSSERISHIERQLHRFDDLDTKLSEVRQDLSQRLCLFEERLLESIKTQTDQPATDMESMRARMEQLMTAMESAISNSGPFVATATTQESSGQNKENSDSNNIQRDEKSQSMGSESQSLSTRSSGSSSMGGESSSQMDSESTGHVQSPEHKRQRSRRNKIPLHDSIRRHLDNRNFSNSVLNNPASAHPEYISEPAVPGSPPLSLSTPPDGPDSIEENVLLTPRSPTPPASSENPDPECQYTDKPFHPADDESPNQEGTTSHSRGSAS
jgi:hypothetical protein